MKIILTGSLGHISKPLAAQLIQNGHDVSIISSIKDRREDITKLGAKPIIGSLEDAKFVTDAFFGADAVYTMVPPNDYTNPNLDLLAYYEQLGHNYAHAIKANSIKRVVNLSSIGAHLEHGSGILLGAHRVEQILDAVSQGVAITHIRPTSFYYNLFAYIPSIRQANVIAVNHGESHTLSWVAPIDIADAVAAELQDSSPETKVRYIASDERSGREIAQILGKAIGQPGLKWTLISNAEMEQNLIGRANIQPAIAAGLTQMWASYETGLLSEDYELNKPAVFGKVKFEDFATEFASVYKRSEQN